ncbi:ornithine cyclodeaminase/alanine dehydrogenase-like protein (mu-crystallin family) [Rhizobium sp. BK313]|uniref:ornithine cyclodeaminase family protein n=1 Tax=Rhizobium sp. BK313 TaxID=2587081 RepID=UPI00105D4EE3|nr:ornithine cyclodeaminase family protein [Rhizobium sp. BK313]MBB3458779.1 ornithine cyclodeaminase/alanine dehydrogenase-like protein (mu-crystallin family) [Rhizobium sp. BK313]
MLYLSNDDVDALLDMTGCIESFEHAYRAAFDGSAINGRRSDMITATTRDDNAVYSLKMVGGVVPGSQIGAVRINSDILSFPTDEGRTRKVKVPAAPGGRWVGLIMLFSSETGEPLAILPDGVLQRMRVGATSGLAIRYLARAEASTVAILGSGWQASAQAMAAAAVRPLSEIRIFSPNHDNARAFAGDVERRLELPAKAFQSPEDAVLGADIVLCATNSLQAVFKEEWVKPGIHIGSIRDGEIDPGALLKADNIVVHDPGNMGSDHLVVAKGLDHKEGRKEVNSDPRLAAIASAPSLAALVGGAASARRSADEITCFLNFHGLGYQFAAAGAALLARARAAGRGHQLPADWFTQNVHS